MFDGYSKCYKISTERKKYKYYMIYDMIEKR